MPAFGYVIVSLGHIGVFESSCRVDHFNMETWIYENSVTQLQTWSFGRGCECGSETGLDKMWKDKIRVCALMFRDLQDARSMGFGHLSR